MGILDISNKELVAYGIVAILLYSAALAVYRVTLHPLAKFPGPRLAATTEWYEFYHDIVRQGKFIWHIQKLHDQYGPIVRIMPNELHIRDPDYYDEIYAPSSKKRDKSAAWVTLGGSTGSVFATADHNLHRQRRAVLNPFFSKKSIADKEVQIREKVEHLCRRLTAAATAAVTGEGEGEGEVVRVDVAFTELTMDIITDFAFGERTTLLDEPDFGLVWKESLIKLSANGVILRQFPWIWPVLKRIPLWLLQLLRSPAAGLVVWQHLVRARIENIIALNREGADKKVEGSIFQTVLDSDVPPEEKSLDRLQDEAQIVVGAGTETTAKSLSFIAFYLNEDPAKLQRARDEIKTAGPELDGSFSLAKLEKLPYLTACIMEGLRMMSGVTGRLPRVAHETLHYQDWAIPAGTPVSQMNWVVNNDPNIFPQPLEFRPDRWIEAERAGIRLDRYMVSFMRGSRSCLGINLAWAELYLALAYVIARFDLVPYDTVAERDVHIDRDLFVGVPKPESKGIRATVVLVGKD
ncbi:Cytochrome P450 monooxygenase sdnE [Apiospora kogelbergensis]|uniref:Cytochrome P450 monooxygenase sdnE n=1 Tax=Apiospora kogelbergensis TaxID=1337665 RepID=A0AAW0R3U5_9PEZI